ncbi:hypothetical protein D3C85_1676110 [compost metagenome]
MLLAEVGRHGGRIPKLKQQLQLMDGLLDILATLARLLRVTGQALDYTALQKTQLVSLDVLDWLNLGGLVVVAPDLSVEG